MVWPVVGRVEYAPPWMCRPSRPPATPRIDQGAIDEAGRSGGRSMRLGRPTSRGAVFRAKKPRTGGQRKEQERYRRRSDCRCRRMATTEESREQRNWLPAPWRRWNDTDRFRRFGEAVVQPLSRGPFLSRAILCSTGFTALRGLVRELEPEARCRVPQGIRRVLSAMRKIAGQKTSCRRTVRRRIAQAILAIGPAWCCAESRRCSFSTESCREKSRPR